VYSTCRVSAVGLKLITFQCFDRFQDAVLGVFSRSEAIAEAVWVEKEMNVDRFRVNFSAFNFVLADRDITTKIKILVFYMMATCGTAEKLE